MSFLRSVFDDKDALESLGIEARSRARAAGVDSYFSDPKNDGQISVEHPDGSITADHRSAGRRPRYAFG